MLWKREGAQGYYLCRIIAVRPDAPQPYTIEVVKHEWWGATTLSGTRRRRVHGHVLRRP